MNEALSQKLLDDFPRLFRDRHTSSLGNGFLYGDGWFDLDVPGIHHLGANALRL
jgi:hypothetical protein